MAPIRPKALLVRRRASGVDKTPSLVVAKEGHDLAAPWNAGRVKVGAFMFAVRAVARNRMVLV